MARDYHHGELPTALRKAAVDLIAERGPAGFSLREVARRAGVSHAAPAHHFGDRSGLLSSVAAEGFAVLGEAMTEAAGIEDPRERLAALGQAYVRTAVANPGHYKVMIGHEFTNEDDAELQAAGMVAYAFLTETVEALRDHLNPDLDVDSTATILWSGVHGLVELAPATATHVAEVRGTVSHSIEELVVRYTDLIIDGILTRD